MTTKTSPASTVRLSCPLCKADGAPVFTAESIGIADCTACGHRYADYSPDLNHVSTVYADEYFFGGGAGYDDYLAEARLLRARGRWYARKIRRWVAPGRMLDVGAAAGLFLSGFLESGWEGEGVEPNERMARTGAEQFQLPVVHSSWEDYSPTGEFDLVTMVQVLPHFVDPAEALRKAVAALRPGGSVLIETWNSDSLTARFFGRGWHEYSPPSVLHWFSPARLSAFGRTLGLTAVTQGRPSKWIEAGHGKSLVRYKLKGSMLGRLADVAMKIIPDRLALPYPAQDLFWLLLRKDA